MIGAKGQKESRPRCRRHLFTLPTLFDKASPEPTS